MVSAISFASAAISIASTPSAISSPAPAPDNADPQHTFGLRIEDQLRHAFGAIDGHSAAGSRPGKLRDFDLAAFFLA